MSSKPSNLLVLAIVAGIILGGLVGYFLPGFALSISFIGQLFLNALRVVVLPLIVAIIIAGMAAMADTGKIRRSVGKALLYFLGTGVIAVLIGLILVHIIKPGAYASAAGVSIPPALSGITSFSINKLLGSIIPENLFAATAGGQFLGLVIFAIFFGAVVTSLGARGKIVIDFFEVVGDVVKKIALMLMWVAPVGLFSLVAAATAGSRLSMTDVASSLGMLSLTLAIGFILQAFVIMPLFLRFIGQRSFAEYFGKMSPALLTALGTSSSAATLPVTYECVAEKAKVDKRATSFTLPLGAMINMSGSSMYLVIAAVFCAQLFQIDLSVVQVLLVVVMSLIVSLGSSLIPNTSLLMLAIVLFYADFPPAAFAGVALILTIDWLFDRFKTAVNVWGDAVGAVVVSETFDFKTARNVESSDRGSRSSMRSRRQVPPKRGDQQRRPSDSDRSGRRDRPERQESRKREDRRDRQQRQRGPGGRDSSRSRGDRGERRPRPQPNGKRQDAKPEKSSGFVMPPVPYHVLETELRGKGKPAPDKVESAVAADATPKDVTPPREAIDREKARVAAQLEMLDAQETRRGEDTSPGVPTEQKPENTQVAEKAEEYPKGDFFSNSEKVEENDAIPESVATEVSPSVADESDAAEEESRPSAFGRGKSRRTPLPKGSSSTEPTPTEDKPESGKPEFDSENISFGRGKRKK